MSAVDWVLASLAIFAGACAQGSMGFGLGMIAAPFLAMIEPSLIPAPVLIVAMGLAALVAVKMLLVLYNDKEKNSNEFHGRLSQVIEAQISVNKDMIASNNELIKTMNEIKTLTHENRTIFLRHISRELVE